MTKRKEYKLKKLEFIEKGKNNGPEWERILSDEIVVKELSNSMYGIQGLEFGRYYSPNIAESITLFGQWCILFAKKIFEEMGYTVLYGDTDSVFILTENADIKKILDEFHKRLYNELKEKYNIDECFIELEFDKEFNNFILISKKNYVGHAINVEGKNTNLIYARGVEFIKRDTFKYGAEKQEELIKLLFQRDLNFDDIVAWVEHVRNEFHNKEFTKEELVISQRVGSYVNSYKSKTLPVHARLAKEVFDQTGEDLSFSEVKYIVTAMEPHLQGVRDVDFNGKYDKRYYWERRTAPLLERILKVVIPDKDWSSILVYDKEKQLNLF